MEELIIPLNGKNTKIEIKKIHISKLKLDELNPRISFFKDNQLKNELNEDEIIFALTNKKPEAFKKLKDSIHNNRGIMQPIWVEPLTDDQEYKVIEGNSRVVIYKQLKDEEPNEHIWDEILSYVLPFSIDNEQKNFIRLQSHLRGTTEWDAYEKAKYLYKLWEEDGWSINKLVKQTKLNEKQIKENIDAYKIMEEKYLPKYGDDPNEVSKFSYFVEYVKDKKLQKFMEKKDKNVTDFCEWVADNQKLPTGQDVRKLRYIFEDDDTISEFINKGFDSAIKLLEIKKPNITSSFYKDIENVIDGLKNINAYELDDIINERNSTRELMLRELAEWSKKVIDMIEKEKNVIKKA
jgi:hypothetical protein